MPELPEVETVARLVRPDLVGRSIVGVRVQWERSLGGPSTRAFGSRVRGCRIDAVRRRGKHIVMDLSRSDEPAGAIVCHLRMTGRLHVEPKGTARDPYSRVELRLDDGATLRFVDVRKFGRFQWVPDAEAFLAHLGPEPLSPQFTGPRFAAALGSRRRVLKPLLLDQEFVVGLGNIYVDEALHVAGLHPLWRSDRVTRDAALRLHRAVRRILREAIRREGSSFDAFYRTPEGQPGSYQHQFRVYGRHGRPCRTCERTIQRIVVGQRGTHICTQCQPAPRPSGPSGPSRAERSRTRVVVRRARIEDADEIGLIHMTAWQSAYRGILAQGFLDGLDLGQWQARRRTGIREPRHPESRTWVVTRGDEILGFAVSGPTRDADDDGDDDDNGRRTGEVYAIYLRPGQVGRGLGRRLFTYALSALRRGGKRESVVWVLDRNDLGKRFYEAAGMHLDGGLKTIRLGGDEHVEVRYRVALQ